VFEAIGSHNRRITRQGNKPEIVLADDAHLLLAPYRMHCTVNTTFPPAKPVEFVPKVNVR
jgi:hypothetical protein